MWTQTIGQNAGALWKILNAKKEMNLSALKKQAKLDDKQIYLALGWLAREGKIKLEMQGRQSKISLK